MKVLRCFQTKFFVKMNDQFLYDDDGFTLVYIDGACSNNGRPNAAAGLGVWFNDDHRMNISAPVKGPATNNRGEIQAATRAIYAAGNSGITKLRVVTDSKFLLNAVDCWMYTWRRRNWHRANGEPLKNMHDFKALDTSLRTFHMDIEFEYVRAHSGVAGNEEADRLARCGAQQYYQRYVK